MAAFEQSRQLFSFGDVVYLDRGRADGVEIGNIFNIYSFTDQSTKERITEDPTYKVGELRVISLSDDFFHGHCRGDIFFHLLGTTCREQNSRTGHGGKEGQASGQAA